MSYEVLYHQEVVKQDIPALAQTMKQRVKVTIEAKLLTRPELFGIPLRQSLKGHRKLRVGSYRVVFTIKKATVIVLAI